MPLVRICALRRLPRRADASRQDHRHERHAGDGAGRRDPANLENPMSGDAGDAQQVPRQRDCRCRQRIQPATGLGLVHFPAERRGRRRHADGKRPSRQRLHFHNGTSGTSGQADSGVRVDRFSITGSPQIRSNQRASGSHHQRHASRPKPASSIPHLTTEPASANGPRATPVPRYHPGYRFGGFLAFGRLKKSFKTIT